MATPQRSIRVPDDVWKSALDAALERGESLPQEIVKFLRRYALRTANSRLSRVKPGPVEES